MSPARETMCGVGHEYVRPTDAPDALPCPECTRARGQCWVVPTYRPVSESASYTATDLATASTPALSERYFRRVHGRIGNAGPWLPGWVEEIS